jgi:hypothetical protein
MLCPSLLIVLLSVVLLNVVMLSVVILNVVAPKNVDLKLTEKEAN